MSLPGFVTTTLYAEGTAIALVIGLIVHTAGIKKKNGTRENLFNILTGHALCLAITGVIVNVLLAQESEFAILCGKAIRNLYELFILCILFYWLLFMDYLLYGSKDHLYRKYTVPFIPIVISALLLAANAFAHFLFEYDNQLNLETKPFYWVLIAFEYLYVLNTIILMIRFYSKNQGPNFIRILPFLVPFVAGSILTRISPYEVRSLGVAVGLVLLHFSLMNERCYKDEETGFYNIAFLKYIAGFATEHESSGGCAIVFDGAEKGDELGEIILDEVPDNSAVVNVGHGRYLVLSSTQSKTAINYLISAVTEAAYEKDIEISSDYSVRSEDVSAEDFIKRIIDLERM